MSRRVLFEITSAPPSFRRYQKETSRYLHREGIPDDVAKRVIKGTRASVA